MSRKLCFLSSKGGSGKTTTASALGTFLSLMGKRVLIVDTDAATNGMTLLYLNQLIGKKKVSKNKQNGLFEADGSVVNFISITDMLDFVPASFHMSDTDSVDPEKFNRSLSSVIEACDPIYDFIIMDAQAGTDHYARIAAKKADEVVLVSEYDPLSAQGTERLKIIMGSVIDPSSTWTLFNKVLPEFATLVGDGLSIARYLPPIPWDADVVRALSRRDLALDMESPNIYTLSIVAIANEIYPDEIGVNVEDWRDGILSTKVHPISDRISEISGEIDEIVLSTRKKSALLQVGSNVGVASLALVVTMSFPMIESLSGMDYLVPRSISWQLIAGLSGVVAAVLAAAVGAVAMMRAKTRADINDFRLGRLRNERERLRTARDSARSALENIQKAGFYAEFRRRPN